MPLKEFFSEKLLTRRDFCRGLLLTSFALPKLIELAEYEEGWNELENNLRGEIERYQTYFAPQAEVALSLLDLQTGARFSFAGDEDFQPGCVINQFVLYSLVEDFQKGLFPYEPLAREIYLAVGESKADRAKNLLALTGGGSLETGVQRANQLMQNLGLKRSFMDHPPAFSKEFSLQGGPNLMTTNEAVEVMAKLYRDKLLNDQNWTDFTIQRLTEGKPGLNIYIGLYPRYIPGVRVAHKVGYFPDSSGEMDGDAGLVLIDTPKGEIGYAMAILSRGNPSSPPDKPSFVYNGWFTWRTSRLVYEFFQNHYLG